jgi:trimethylamine--corrinoid protein Co-methyltransferase
MEKPKRTLRQQHGEEFVMSNLTDLRPESGFRQNYDRLAVDKINEAALRILEGTGLRFDNAEAIEIFRKAGAKIKDGKVVHIQSELVDWALKCAPKNIAIYDRHEEVAMDLGGDRNYYGAGSDCANLYDLETGQRRQAVLDDVHNGILILDALPNVDFAMSMLMPADVPLGRHEMYQMEAMLAGTVKPMVFVGESEASTVCAAEMLAAVRGSYEALAAKPLGINYVNSVSPFIHNDQSVRRLMYGAKMNMPTVYHPGQGRGTISPMTAAGTVALGQAAQMGVLVLHQLVREGAPMIRGLPGDGLLDLKSMVSIYLSPDIGRLGWLVAKADGLPLFGTAGCSDAKIFDVQAAAEAAMSLVNASLSGANLIHNLGYLDSAMTYCFELLTLSDEIVGWLRHLLAPRTVDDEALALEAIDELSRKGGNFLSHRHTLKHLKETWTTDLFDHLSYANWLQKGGLTCDQKIKANVARLLKEHRPEPLPPAVRDRLTEIRSRYVSGL